MSENQFDQAIGGWQEWQSQPWGRLVYSTSRLNLNRHLTGSPLHVLDIGGGNGMDSLYFARLGHSVTLLDVSPAMLEQAHLLAGKEGLGSRLMVQKADANEIVDVLGESRFDLILCHLLIEFVDDSETLFRDACGLLNSEGIISILDVNCYSDCYVTALLTQDLSKALEAVGSKTYLHPWTNQQVPRFSTADVADLLMRNDCEILGQYGIRSICDYLPNELKYEPDYYAGLERLEHRLTDVYPYYLMARMFQVIGRRARP